MKLQLLGESGHDVYDDNSSQLSQNWYQHTAIGGKSKLALYPTPGLTLFSDIGTGPIRGEINYNGLYFIISGDTFYEVDSGGTAVSRGTLNTSVGICKLDHNGAKNGKQICIVDGLDLYIWDSDALDFKVITDISDADYDPDCPTGATHVEFLDTFFIVNNPAKSGEYYKSAGYDGTSWDGLDFATAERSPDELQGILKVNRVLWLVGKTTAEPHHNTGAADFPFEPIQGGFSEWGTIAPYSLVETAGLGFWVSQNEEGAGMIIMVSGLQPQIISTPEIAAELAEISDLSDCYAYTYQKYQHTFIVFTFPSGQKTIVFDTTEKKFHTWKSKTLGYHRSTGHTFIYNKHLVGDPLNGRIYYLDWDNKTDNGDLIDRRRISAAFHANDKGLDWDVVELDIKEGVGNSLLSETKTIFSGNANYITTSAVVDLSIFSIADGISYGDTITTSTGTATVASVDGATIYITGSTIPQTGASIDYVVTGNRTLALPAQIHLRWRDGNGAWSNWHSRSMGKIGERNKRVRWRQLGYSDTSRVYEIRVTDPVTAVLLDGYARVKYDQTSMR